VGVDSEIGRGECGLGWVEHGVCGAVGPALVRGCSHRHFEGDTFYTWICLGMGLSQGLYGLVGMVFYDASTMSRDMESNI